MSSTIVATATATGVSSISIIRVSGEMSLSIAKKITKKREIKPLLFFSSDSGGHAVTCPSSHRH